MRKGAVVASVALLLLAAVVIVVPRLVSLDTLKPRLLAAIEEKTGRKASLDRLSLSLFPAVAIRLEGLSVAGDPGHEAEALLSVNRGEVRLSLLPLLSGKVVLSKILLDRPSVVFHRYPDGSHSLTETLRRLAPAEGEEEGKEKEKEKAGKGAPFAVAIRSVAVSDASLSVRTAGEKGGETRLDLSPVSVSLSGLGEGEGGYAADLVLSGEVRGKVSAEGTFRAVPAGERAPAATAFSGGGKAFGHPFTFEGRRDRAEGGEGETELSLSFPSLEMGLLLEPFASPPAALLPLRPEGKGSLSVRLSGTAESLGFEAEGDLTQAGWTVRPGLRKEIGEPCSLVVQGRRFPDRVIVSNGELRFPPLALVANGSLSPASGGREWAFHARLDDLSSFARSRAALSRYSPEGRVTVQGKGRRFGREEREEYTVDADLSAVAFRVPDRPVELRDVAGHVTLLPEAIHFQPLGGLLSGQRFRVAGQVGLSGGARGDLELRMAWLDLDSLLAALEEGGQGPREGGGGKEGVQEAGKESPWAVTARVAIDGGKAGGIEFTDLAGTVRAAPGRYEVENGAMKAFGGSVSATGWARTGGAEPAFQGKVALRDVSADRLLSWRTSLKGYLDGKTNLAADLSGKLGGGDALARTLAGKGKLTLSGAKVRGFNLVGAATGAVGLPPLPGLPAPSVPETALSDLAMDFTVSDGRVRTENLALRSGKSSFRGAGSFGLDRTVDLAGTLRLPPEAAAKSAGRYLLTAGGNLDLPVRVTGPLASPSVSVDAAAVARGAATRAVQGLVDSLSGGGAPKGAPEGGRGTGEGAPAEGAPAQAPPGGETGKVLKGLFDRLLPRK